MTDPRWIAVLEKFESHRNQPGGFWVASASPEAGRFAIEATFDTDTIDLVLMMTDGVSSGVDDYGTPADWCEAADIARRDPAELVDLVHDTETTDPDTIRGRRSKTHDDKALAVITIANGDKD